MSGANSRQMLARLNLERWGYSWKSEKEKAANQDHEIVKRRAAKKYLFDQFAHGLVRTKHAIVQQSGPRG